MRIVFAGSPEIAVPALTVLAAEHTVTAVLTNPPSLKGRKGTPEPTPVGAAANMLLQNGAGFSVLTPLKLDQEVRDAITECKPDILVCFAYGKIFGPKFMALFPCGGINMHPSLLPRYRGATPIPAAILARESETGFTVQTIAKETDAGDIILQKKYIMTGRETTASLSCIAATQGAELLVQALRSIEQGTAVYTPQNHEQATYCGKITKEMGGINWAEPAAVIDAKIRAYTPWPGSFTDITDTQGNTKKLIIHRAHPVPSADEQKPGTITADRRNGIFVQTGNGQLQLEELQWQTKKVAGWKEFLNGTQNFAAMTFV